MTTIPEIAPDRLSAYWMPFTPNKAFKAAPRLVDRAHGQFLELRGGQTIRDGMSGLWCSILGHNHPAIGAAICEQSSRLDYAPAFNFGHEPAFELATIIARQFPGALDHVFFTNSGSEAVDTALKMALAYHRLRGEGSRTRLIGRVNGYHGVGFGGTSVGGMSNNRKHFGQLLGGIDHLPFPYDRARNAFTRGEPESDPMEFLSELENMIALHDAGTIAAVIVEPFLGSAGVFVPPKGYLGALRDITRKHGILLILDEVISGFGRLGQPNAATFFGVEPDLCTLAKGINNGAVPMGAVVASSEIYQTFMNSVPMGVEFFHGYTYSAHPLAVAAALATQAAIAEENVYQQTRDLAPYFEEALHSLRDEPYVSDIRNIGLAGGLTLDSDGAQPGQRAYEVFLRAIDYGVYVRNNGDTIAIVPILTSTPRDIDEIIDAVRAALRGLS